MNQTSLPCISLMASSSSPKELSSDQPLNYKTWVLKVSIHCEGCKAKVKKVLHKISGVYTTSIDTQQQRVTVTGTVDVQTLINKLIKTGKHAQIWPQTQPTKPKNKATQSFTTNNNNNNNISSTKMEAQGSASTATTSEAGVPKARQKGQRSKERDNSPEKSSAGEAEGGGGSKRKRKGQKGNSGNASRGAQLHSYHDQLGSNEGVNHNYYNLNHTQQQSYWHPYNNNNNYYYYYYYYPHQYYGTFGSSKTAPSWPYTCQQGVPLGGSLEMFSDENVNGCFIM